MKIEICDEVLAELELIVQLNNKNGVHIFNDVAELVDVILTAIADGSRRPGSWERQMLQMLGIATDDPAHQNYRATYGLNNRDET